MIRRVILFLHYLFLHHFFLYHLFLHHLLCVVTPSVDGGALSLFPISSAVVHPVGGTLKIVCKADGRLSSSDLTWLYLPFQDRRKSRSPRIKYANSRTQIL